MKLDRRPIEEIPPVKKERKTPTKRKHGEKGGDFEREIAKKLSLWYSGGSRDDIFYRSHSSGARFTARKKSGKDTAFQSGDITCSDPEGKDLIEMFSIECKSGYASKGKNGLLRWDVLDLLDSKQKEPLLIALWKQCKHDAEEANKTPLLIFRRNQRSECIALQSGFTSRIEEYYGPSRKEKIYIGPGLFINIMRLSDFFEWIEDGMRQMLRKES